MIGMKPRWYETRAASRAISNFLALTEKVKRANHKRKEKQAVCAHCPWTDDWKSETLRCYLMGNQQINRFYSRKRFKSWRRSKKQNCPHFFKIIILSWCRKLTHVVCALALMVQFHKQSCLVEVNYLLLVNECAWVVLHVVVVLSELYPKAKTELIVEISRMEKNQINVVLSKLCWNVQWLYLILKTS